MIYFVTKKEVTNGHRHLMFAPRYLSSCLECFFLNGVLFFYFGPLFFHFVLSYYGLSFNCLLSNEREVKGVDLGSREDKDQ